MAEAEHPALVSLRTEWGQIDEDGVCISVSRQAVEETLAIFDEMKTALKGLLGAYDAVLDQIANIPPTDHPASWRAIAAAALAKATA